MANRRTHYIFITKLAKIVCFSKQIFIKNAGHFARHLLLRYFI